MAINPIVFTEKVVRSFLQYQLTTYSFSDPDLYSQMRTLLSLDETRRSPLMKGPYISLSRPFRQGASISDLIHQTIFHPHMRERIPSAITHVYYHQEQAIQAIHDRRTTLISTGTGSGKTECFLYPIMSRCLELRDRRAPAGISAVIVYPMNALAEDQLTRLRFLLAGSGISFGMYVGKTPETESGVSGFRLADGASRADYQKKLEEARHERHSETVHPPEEVCSREVMRTAGRQPRILLTNVKQLELLLTRQRDVELFADARLDFIVFDEAHTFTGAQGAETACLIRRLRVFCNRGSSDTVCIATSATIADRSNPNAGQEFASRFFGVPAESVCTVGESYEPDVWSTDIEIPPAPSDDPAGLLNTGVQAVEEESGRKIRSVVRGLTGTDLKAGDWPDVLYERLAGNAIIRQLSETLTRPRLLSELPGELESAIGRSVTESEILCWLTLGAAARHQGRPLLRPVVHVFVRGISGSIVTFPELRPSARLWLAAEDEIKARTEGEKYAHFPVMTCTTCGQHYYISFLKDFDFTGKEPGGGDASGNTVFWPRLDESLGGCRVVLVDHLVSGNDDGDIEGKDHLAPIYFCRSCGAAHSASSDLCRSCGITGTMVRLHAIRPKKSSDNSRDVQRKKVSGYLARCISCGAAGKSSGVLIREPARPVRATAVADVHILAQDMLHRAERPRLLVFCDNRQDAAFQAGWMKDHARRYRLRSLMIEGITAGNRSIGDLTCYLEETLDRNESLSRALIPEVWQVVRKEGSGGRHEQERRKFLRIQILREVTIPGRNPIGLEPWGRMRVEYDGLDETIPWIQDQSAKLGISAGELREGIAGVLDYLRRRRILHDPVAEIFTRYWMEGDLEVQQGYLPLMRNPIGTKLRGGIDEDPQYRLQWISDHGDTMLRQIARKWGVNPDHPVRFLQDLFELLRERGLLTPVQLKGARGNPLSKVNGLWQVNADRLRLKESRGVWQCRSCRRRTARNPPHGRCLAWRCDGTVEFVSEDPDNYNLQMLDQSYVLLRPEEHSAMVPHDERERLENLFKGDSKAINTFVCTPTLELGVDIGQIDAILMRNVPPLPTNYWQRAGRAGRRHRMAVNITYCRPVSHDRAYFAEPIKLLTGRIDPPAFNLRNELMVARHVHAAVITRLHQYIRDPKRPETDRTHIEDVLQTCLPAKISEYLFEDGSIRESLFGLGPLTSLIDRNAPDLLGYVEGVFRQGWPEPDAPVTTSESLRQTIGDMVGNLTEVIVRLRKRMRWAMDQIRVLNTRREQHGDLNREDEQLFRRCDALIKRLKGTGQRYRRDMEGTDDSGTFSVLAAEGFLPGYGLETGSVLGIAEIPYWHTAARLLPLPRPPGCALREYVPGNLIYSNGHRFVARRFQRDIDEQRSEMPVFEISTERQAIRQTNRCGVPSSGASATIETIAVCDVDLMHQSHISDEEELRFQLGVAVYGIERDQHNGGWAFVWGSQTLHHRRGIRLRLVNVGAPSAIERYGRYGYPVCTICGQSVSPLASTAQLAHFQTEHTERCGKKPNPIGFYADIVADAISLPACPDKVTAYSVMESLRIAATRVLDMHMEDLQVLVIGHVNRNEVDALLWDPMPGGSGLLDQIVAHFEEIIPIALEVANQCPSACGSSCVDCLQTFRNGYYHKHLDRKAAMERMGEWGSILTFAHDIPARLPVQNAQEEPPPVNEVERRLRHLLIEAGFPEGIRGKQIILDRSIGTTTPDVFYQGDHHDADEGICIYLDGLSEHLHGNPATREKDGRIRTWLRNNGYEVIEIAVSDLGDVGAMIRHFRRLAGYLHAVDLRETVRTDTSWFNRVSGNVESTGRFVIRRVTPLPEERYNGCLPWVPLRIAAGAFSDPQTVSDDHWEWVKVDTRRRLKPGMFVAQVVGKSMEPGISDGSYGIFSAPVTGSRQGRILLVQLRDQMDPETGERYTIKRYSSRKTVSADGIWRHVEVTLDPTNPEFEPIVLTCEDEGMVQVIAEWIGRLE